MTEAELQKTYAELTTSELLEIINRKFEYTELAVSVANAELGKRKISEAELETYYEEQAHKAVEHIHKNITFDLSLLQKLLFFFVWFPLFNFPFRQNFRDAGFELKLRQANYYSLIGGLSCIGASMLCTLLRLSTYSMFAVWTICFLAGYGFDEFFNRRMLIGKMRAMYDPTEEPEQEGEYRIVK